jgi:predicted lipoprotein with Yx(FWY)xxD motif
MILSSEWPVDLGNNEVVDCALDITPGVTYHKATDSIETELQERHHMAQTSTALTVRSNVKGRVAAALLVVGGLGLTFGAVAASGAVHSHTSGVVISTSKTAKHGTILISGRTVYTLKPSSIKCTTKCLKFWAAVVLPTGVKKATAGTGVSASKLGTVKDSAGKTQVTYGGKALYFFYLDKSPGQVKGNVTDTWGKWSNVVLVKPAHPVTTTTSGGGGGVGF